jgi:hypothetical protein
MQFETYIIEENPNKTTVTISNVFAVITMLALVACIIGLYKIGTFLFVFVVIGGVVFALIKKGNIQPYVVSKNKLVITNTAVEIAGIVYQLNNIQDLRFFIHSYAGLDYMADGLKTSDGMNNYVSFISDEKKINCRFILGGATHVLSLCRVFQEFYYKRIPFIEIDRGGIQTYLLQRLDEKELAAFKEKYGY